MPTSARGAPKRRPDLDTVFTINADGSRNFIQLADVRGRWQRRKHAIWLVLILVYLALPFVHIGGHPAVHIDIPGRTASFFGATFTNQDFYLSFFVFTAIWFVLFVVTSLWGRVWCGYACPQTVFLEGVFRRVERVIEGSREQRQRRALAHDPVRHVRTAAKHAAFLLISSVVAHAFVAYFLPLRELWNAIANGPAGHRVAFSWVTIWTGILYFNYVWFREQTCLILCPYGRLQGALVDADTVMIGYDAERGEPRSKKTKEGGDCIDCNRCVTVCPTGIDIRHGLQMECIGCANCVDACDEVMERLGRPSGLIRYDSRRGFDTGKRRSIRRPRVFVYMLLGVIGLGVATWAFSGRRSFTAHVLRAPGLPYQLLDENRIVRNVYTIRIQNKTDTAHAYRLEPGESEGSGLRVIVSQPDVEVDPLGDRSIPVVVEQNRAAYVGNREFTISIRSVSTDEVDEVKMTFRGPGGRK